MYIIGILVGILLMPYHFHCYNKHCLIHHVIRITDFYSNFKKKIIMDMKQKYLFSKLTRTYFLAFLKHYIN